MIWRWLPVAAALILTACSRAPSQDAEFRYVARHMYDDLSKPSCSAPPGFDRAKILAPQFAAVRTFEEEVRGTLAFLQLDIAHMDAVHARSVGQGCWADEDPAFAAIHIKFSQDAVSGGLARLRKLVPATTWHRQVAATSREDAAFREAVRGLVVATHPMCRVSKAEDNDRIMDPARQELGRFRNGLDSHRAYHYDIAAADVHYEQSVTMVECGAPGTEPPDRLRKAALEEVKAGIAKAAQIAKAGPPES